MSILILNTYSYNKAPYEKWLSDLKEELILFNSPKWFESFSHKNFYYSEKFDNYEKNDLLIYKALELNKEVKITRVIAPSELDLMRASEIREFLGIDGQNVLSTKIYRNKIEMKNKAIECGIKVPNFKQILNALDLLEFINKYDYPVVVKPIDGAGSKGTTILNNNKELQFLLEKGIEGNLEVEEFIEGDMYHIDGLINDNKIIINWPSLYINGCLAFQEGKYLGSHMLSKDNPLTKKLQNFVHSILEKFPTPSSTAFHAEVFHTKNNELILCEIASRVGGAKINDVIEKAFNINLLKNSVQGQAGIQNKIEIMDTPNLLYGWALIPPQEGILEEWPSEELPIDVVEYEFHGNVGQKFTGANLSIDKIATFIVSGKDEVAIKNKIDTLTTWFSKNVKWKKSIFDESGEKN